MGVIQNLENLLAAGRDNALLRFGLGSAYYTQKEYAKAVPHLQSCIAQDANYSAAYKLLGKALMRDGRRSEAKTVFEAGLPVAAAKGDKQTEREILASLKKLA